MKLKEFEEETRLFKTEDGRMIWDIPGLGQAEGLGPVFPSVRRSGWLNHLRNCECRLVSHIWYCQALAFEKAGENRKKYRRLYGKLAREAWHDYQVWSQITPRAEAMYVPARKLMPAPHNMFSLTGIFPWDEIPDDTLTLEGIRGDRISVRGEADESP